jgi:hypothetical protein
MLAAVHPWGRSFDEYRRMFSLSESDLGLRIIGCADGPAAFNCQLTRRGGRIVSCDPLYRHGAADIRARVDETRDRMVSHATKNAHLFVWTTIRSPEEMGSLRMQAMAEFLDDFEIGKRAGRYVDQSLPRLDWADDAFDLALCSHFLFLYSDEFSAEFHVESILEMCRVAKEARVFPLLDMRGEKSAHLEPTLRELKNRGYVAAIETVNYEFQRGGNEMLRIRRGDA